MRIVTDRLEMFTIKESHSQDLFQLMSNEEVVKYAIWNKHTNIKDTEKHIKDIYIRHQGYSAYHELVIYDRQAAFLGMCSFRIQEMGTYVPETTGSLGYYLLPEHWGKGYATEIAKALIKVLFNHNVERIITTCDPNNQSSFKVMERCGMRYEGHMKHDKLMENGVWRDSLHYSISKKEAEALKINYYIDNVV